MRKSMLLLILCICSQIAAAAPKTKGSNSCYSSLSAQKSIMQAWIGAQVSSPPDELLARMGLIAKKCARQNPDLALQLLEFAISKQWSAALTDVKRTHSKLVSEMKQDFAKYDLDQETEINRLVTEYNSLVKEYNSLLSVTQALAAAPPQIQTRTVYQPIYVPSPPQIIRERTVTNCTSNQIGDFTYTNCN